MDFSLVERPEGDEVKGEWTVLMGIYVLLEGECWQHGEVSLRRYRTEYGRDHSWDPFEKHNLLSHRTVSILVLVD